MGVQQQIELQNQSSVKYFHLKETSSEISDNDSQLSGDNIISKEFIQPRLSVWGWFTPSQYGGSTSTSGGMINLKNIEDSISSLDDCDGKSIQHQQQQSLILESSSLSDSEDGAGPQVKIEFKSEDDETKIKYNTRNNSTLRNSGNKNSNTVLNNNGGGVNISTTTSTKEQQHNTTKYNFSSTDNCGSTIRYPYSPIYSDATFTILCGVVVLFSIIYSLLVGPIQIMFAFLVSILVFISYISASFASNNRVYLYSITALSIGLGLCIPSFFAATGAVVLGTDRGVNTWDSHLYKSDQVLMGWMWPKGQMALFVDTNSIVGPYSFVGRLSTEIFQLSYISYYIWGYFMEIYILYSLWRCHLSKDPQQQKMLPIWDQRLKMFICSWISTYFIVFSINLIFPAESPRVYIGQKLDLYKNKLTGFGFAGFIRDRIDNAAKGSFGSFPSGHIATSFAIGLSSYRIVPAYGFVSTIAAILIAIATMYLRYHYFVDFLAALPVTIFCLFFGGFYTPIDFKNVFVNCGLSIKSLFKRLSNKA